MDMSVFTSFEGRIGRQFWWIGLIVLAVIEWIIVLLLATVLGIPLFGHYDPGTGMLIPDMRANVLFGIIGLIFLWPGLAIYTKRWHDRDKSGWWILIVLIPVIGGLWALIECGFLRGTNGPNRFGPDPLR